MQALGLVILGVLISFLLTVWFLEPIREAHKRRKAKKEVKKNAKRNFNTTFERLVTDLKGTWDGIPRQITPVESSRRIINRFISEYREDSTWLNNSVKDIVNDTVEKINKDLENDNDLDFDYLESQYQKAINKNRKWFL